MDLIKRWSENKKAKSEKFKQMQEDDKLHEMLEERKKSSNERELERHLKDQREAEIKRQLDMIRKRKNQEAWKGNNFNNKMTILNNPRPILKEKNIFLDQKSNNPLTQRRMFFK